MINTALASTAYEVAEMAGDTSATFITRVKRFLNDRYSDCLMRTQSTMWTMASFAALGDASVPNLGLGEVIKKGALADAYDAKRQFQKSAKYEQKYEWALGNYIIAGDYTQINASFSRYDYHEE